jgi:hypothetical protein
MRNQLAAGEPRCAVFTVDQHPSGAATGHHLEDPRDHPAEKDLKSGRLTSHTAVAGFRPTSPPRIRPRTHDPGARPTGHRELDAEFPRRQRAADILGERQPHRRPAVINQAHLATALLPLKPTAMGGF